jgi:hypothetical protein
MKKQDLKVTIPQFSGKKKSGYWKLIPIGIAASLTIAAWFYMGDDPIATLDHDVIIITLEEGQNKELQFKIESTTELESWESPTSSLLTEF